MAKAVRNVAVEVPELLTVEEYADKRRCSISTVRAKILRGDLEIVKLGRLVRIPRSELLREIEAGRVPRRERAVGRRGVE